MARKCEKMNRLPCMLVEKSCPQIRRAKTQLSDYIIRVQTRRKLYPKTQKAFAIGHT